MRPHYSILTRPLAEALDYAAAADHLRVDSAADLTYIEGLVGVACEYVGEVTGRVGAETTFLAVAGDWHDLTLDDYLGRIKIGRAPLLSVTHIKYYAPDAAVLTTLDPAEYRVITTTDLGMLQPVDEWPEVDERPDAIQITFAAGHSESNPAPATWRHAAKMLVAHLYEERKPVAFASCNDIPFTMSNLIEHNRMEGRIG